MDPLNNIASSDLRELFKIFVGSIWSNKEALFTQEPHCILIPRQPNHTDCGYYVMHCILMLIEEYLQDLV